MRLRHAVVCAATDWWGHFNRTIILPTRNCRSSRRRYFAADFTTYFITLLPTLLHSSTSDRVGLGYGRLLDKSLICQGGASAVSTNGPRSETRSPTRTGTVCHVCVCVCVRRRGRDSSYTRPHVVRLRIDCKGYQASFRQRHRLTDCGRDRGAWIPPIHTAKKPWNSDDVCAGQRM